MSNIKVTIFVAAMAAYGLASCSKTAPANTTASQSVRSTPTTESSPSPQQSPTSKTGDFAEAVEDFNGKQYDEAAKRFESITQSDPNNIDAHVYLGRSYRALKKDDEAILAFQEALSSKADHPEANFHLGSIYFERSDYQASLPFFEQAVKSRNNSPEYLMALGDNQRLLKLFDRAIVQYGRVIGFEPDNPMPYFNLGLTYLGLNNKIGARQQARKLESLDKELARKLTVAIGDK